MQSTVCELYAACKCYACNPQLTEWAGSMQPASIRDPNQQPGTIMPDTKADFFDTILV